MVICAHNGRAVGEVFERCLLCKRWRMIGGKTWWRKPMPIAPEDRPEMQDFRAWLKKAS